MRTTLAALGGIALALAATPAWAQDEAAEEESGPITISGNITAVSDYRFRGYTLTDKDPAIQPTVTIAHESGFYVGTWGSNLDDTPLYGEIEIDFYAGWSGEIASGTTLDVAALYYYYPDGTGASDYFEPYASISHAIGPVTAKAGFAWAPSQDGTANTNFYYYYGQLGLEIPETPATVTGRIGRQDLGAFSYTEWAVGLAVNAGPLTFGLQYVDADQRSVFALGDAKAGVVASVAFNF